MASYTVHIKRAPIDPEKGREQAVFVRDGWNAGAFAFGPLWMLANGHVVVGIAALVLQLALLAGLMAAGMVSVALFGLSLVLAVLWGLEGSSLRRLALRWARHDEVALVVASAADEAERRYFSEAPDAPASLPAWRADGFVPHGVSNPVTGLFPQARGSA